jgi:hypothetical protein
VKGLAKPWFPAVLDAQRKLDFQLYPERYAHIREGEYARAEQARQQVGSITLRLIPYYRRSEYQKLSSFLDLEAVDEPQGSRTEHRLTTGSQSGRATADAQELEPDRFSTCLRLAPQNDAFAARLAARGRRWPASPIRSTTRKKSRRRFFAQVSTET